MPTKGGLPKKGDRVAWQPHGVPYPATGTVVERGSGEYWSLAVRYDETGRIHNNVDAAYYWRVGWLKLAEEG